jgi:hypothetical protein
MMSRAPRRIPLRAQPQSYFSPQWEPPSMR